MLHGDGRGRAFQVPETSLARGWYGDGRGTYQGCVTVAGYDQLYRGRFGARWGHFGDGLKKILNISNERTEPIIGTNSKTITFVYTNPEKGLKKVLVKCLVMNRKLFVETLAENSSQPPHLEIDIDDYVGGENTSGNYSALYNNLEKLVNGLEKEVISKLNFSAVDPPSSAKGEGSRSNHPGVTVNEPRGPQIDPSGYLLFSPLRFWI
ncbi:putative proteasome inhibitor isoform 2 [Hibiscus syriacus]|uniref:Proteasome inhibitor isoform 2 n=1 Tax=Hibiscus syriacus TaxID=106335 RepID=A0A6A2WD07_HIBSY|nr:putative proteasome inhibitor isoform 2 [Hibiscus syriacus]